MTPGLSQFWVYLSASPLLWLLVERFQNSNHMGPSEYQHFAVTSPKTATDKNHGIDRLVTLLVYQAAYKMYRRSGSNPLANPILISVILVVCVLLLTKTPYETYFDGARFVHFLVGRGRPRGA